MKLKNLIGIGSPQEFIFVEDAIDQLKSTCPVYKSIPDLNYERLLIFNLFDGSRVGFREDEEIMEKDIKLLVL